MMQGNPRFDAGRQAEENYLKAIFLLRLEKGRAFASDLAEALGISLTTSYSEANRLVDKGLVQPLERRGGRKSNSQTLVLTPAGQEQAENLVKKHQLIQKWLICVGVPPEEADLEACFWEHSVTDKTLEAMQRQIKLGEQAKRGRPTQKQLLSQLHESKEGSGKATVETMLSRLDECGGLEGMEYQSELIKRAGGAKKLEELLDLADAIGGVQKLRTEARLMLRLSGCNKLRRDRQMLLGAKKSIGQGCEGAAVEELALIDSLGGAKKLSKLKNIADAMGGIDRLLSLLSRSYKMWATVFQSEPEQNQ